ncbi:MAG: right-handed parallel beta-helix repeat-containing protein [Planctomycetota bacterium]
MWIRKLSVRLFLGCCLASFGLHAPPTHAVDIYVSDSTGSDANSGTSTAAAVKTLDRAMQLVAEGVGTGVYLKSGDTFQDQNFGRFNRSSNGGTAENPFVIGSYGGDARPVVRPAGTDSGFRIWGDNVNHVRLENIEFSKPLDQHGGGAGVSVLNPMTGLTLDGVVTSGFSVGVQLQGRENEHIHDIVIRNSIIEHSFVDKNVSSGHSSGFYSSNVENLLIENNVFDHNGWNENLDGAAPTKFNHNLYIQSDTVDVVARDNIITRASAAGLQMRPGGVVEGNVFVENSDAFYLSNGQPDANGQAIGNVVLHGSDKDIDGAVAWGIDLKDNAGYAAIGNLVAHGPDNAGAALVNLDGVTTADNVVYDWGNSPDLGTLQGVEQRTIYTYQELLGREATIEAFIADAKAFLPTHSADAVTAYFLEGLVYPRSVEDVALPEPGAASLMALGIAAACVRRKRVA